MRRKCRTKRRYPKNWKAQATACKSRAGWQCEVCKEVHLTSKVSKRTGLLYRMRLHAAHIEAYTDRPRLMALCPSCHARMDWQHRLRQARVRLERLKHIRLLAIRRVPALTYA